MICMSCIGGRHVRCRARDTCTCTICRQRHDILASAPPPKATPRPVTEKLMTEVKAEPKVRAEPKAEPKQTRRPPKFPKPKSSRKYSPDVVAEAAAMKVAGVSWAEIGAHFNVSSEGIRYAVNNYDYEKPEGFPKRAISRELIASAKASITLLETAVASAETTIAQLKAFVEAASDS